MEEPVLHDLKLIITTYNALAACQTPADQGRHITHLLGLFFGQAAPSLNRISADELTAFLLAVPVACGLEQATGKSSGKPTDWGYLYAHLSASFGWTYDYIDRHIKMSQIKEMQGYMEAHPATHLLVAAYLGYEGPQHNAPQAFFDKMRAMAGKPHPTRH